MRANITDVIEMLKIEKSILQDSDYGHSVRTPWKENRLFRDSVICLNLGEEMARIPCRECLLWDFVPAEHRAEEIPCHFIPLNDLKDTVYSLEQAGKREEAEQALLHWLNQTIATLEQKRAKEEAAASPARMMA
jgi:hypothetical protein